MDNLLITARVSNSFKMLRRELGGVKPITQQELADKLGVPQQSLANWESRRSVPEKTQWDKICVKTGKDLGWYFLDHTEPIEIVRGSEAEAFRTFQQMFRQAAQSVAAIGKSASGPLTSRYLNNAKNIMAMRFAHA